jgi:protein-L-isoaspartate(D-aspartate) O-methyltransferase
MRRRMVEQQLAGRSIDDPSILEAFGSVPREAFVSSDLSTSAYADIPLPIGDGQTISQPYVVALMVRELELSGDDRVLDVGTGSGYAAAIMAQLSQMVFSIERHRSLADAARRTVERLGYANIEIACGDGTLGWPDHAPFDAIMVSAGGPRVPEALIDQLAVGGRLVMPVGDRHVMQRLTRLRRLTRQSISRDDLGPVRFVPLVGEQGWSGG